MGCAGAAFGIGAKAAGLVDALALAPKPSIRQGERKAVKGPTIWEGASPRPPWRPLAPDDQLATAGQRRSTQARGVTRPLGFSASAPVYGMRELDGCDSDRRRRCVYP